MLAEAHTALLTAQRELETQLGESRAQRAADAARAQREIEALRAQITGGGEGGGGRGGGKAAVAASSRGKLQSAGAGPQPAWA